MPTNDFRSLNLAPSLLRVIEDMGFTEMTPIQTGSIPALLQGKDLIGQSYTGSGKTAAFVIPILQKIQIEAREPQALILCPTRELCDQVLKECRKFAKAFPGLQTVALIGGQPYPPQTQALNNGVHVIAGTPGRTLEHLRKNQLQVSQLKILVLDEADRMLDEGFADEMTAIIDELPETKQTVFFSATFPDSIEALSRKYQKSAVRVTIDKSTQASPQIKQYVYQAENPEKTDTLLRILQRHPANCTIVFCRTKATVGEIGERLEKMKVSSQVLHGDLTQPERDRATALFRNGSTRILVATDVAARGLDIEKLELVVNVDLPINPEVYIHRIGRTGRAGREGTAVSIATAFEALKIVEIEKATGVKMIRQNLGFENQHGLGAEFQKTATKTIQIAGGKLDKLRPGDILGALTAQPGALVAADIGKIEIHERFSLVAITTQSADRALDKLRSSKIKGKKFKSYFA